MPPPLPDSFAKPANSGVSIFLGVLLGLFVLSAVVSLLDDSLLAFFGRHDLMVIRAILLFLMLPVGFITYLAVAIHPGIPKRVFLPVALFIPVSCVAVLPLLVYFHAHSDWIGWGVSILQVVTAVAVLWWLKGKIRPLWPLVPATRIAPAKFRIGHCAAVLGGGLLVLIPALLLYIGFSAQLAVNHFSDGFVKVSPAGVSMEVRNYLRDDGKKVTLVPMSHVGETDFYQNLAASFPADSVVLMEGVSDNKKIVQTTSNYSKMAESLGVVDQHSAFRPQGRMVAADMDMSEFSQETLDMLKTAMLLHSKGVTPETMPILLKPTPPGLEERLMEDILTKRNHHLLKVLHEQLPGANHIIIPWGAAHMPEIAREIQKSGFRLADTKEHIAIRFGS